MGETFDGDDFFELVHLLNGRRSFLHYVRKWPITPLIMKGIHLLITRAGSAHQQADNAEKLPQRLFSRLLTFFKKTNADF